MPFMTCMLLNGVGATPSNVAQSTVASAINASNAARFVLVTHPDANATGRPETCRVVSHVSPTMVAAWWAVMVSRVCPDRSRRQCGSCGGWENSARVGGVVVGPCRVNRRAASVLMAPAWARSQRVEQVAAGSAVYPRHGFGRGERGRGRDG